jgi:tellurite resistance protein TerC
MTTHDVTPAVVPGDIAGCAVAGSHCGPVAYHLATSRALQQRVWLWVAFYVTLALVFGGVMFGIGGEQAGSEFLAGWVTEYSLSIDNLFVFVLIMASFAVPRKYQQEILMIGILLAILFRGIFILLGAALIASFSWIFYVFGAFLLVIGIQQFFSGREDDAERENRLLVSSNVVSR